MEDLIVSAKAGMIYSAHRGVLFKFESSSDLFTTTTRDKKELLSSLEGIAPWGNSNNYPDQTKAIIESNNTLSWCFERLFQACYASGIVTKRKITNDAGEEILINQQYSEFKEFLKRNRQFKTYTYQKFRDLLRFGISPVEFLVDSSKKIVGFKAHVSKDFRKSLQNERGVIETGFLCSAWNEVRSKTDELITPLPIIENDFDAVEKFKILAQEGNYLYLIQAPSDEKYYPKMPWTTIIKSGWLDISNGEPKFIKALIQNKATINYIIKIKDWYWGAKYGEEAWGAFTPKKKMELRKKEIDEFNEMVTGLEQSGKSMIIDVWTELNSQLEDKLKGTTKFNFSSMQDAWEITKVPQNDFSGSLKEDANTARIEIMLATGIDPSTFGSVPQQNHQGGSGKTQSMNVLLVISEFIRQLVVQDLEFIRDFNGWPEDMVFSFELPIMQTLAAMPVSQRTLQPNQQ